MQQSDSTRRVLWELNRLFHEGGWPVARISAETGLAERTLWRWKAQGDKTKKIANAPGIVALLAPLPTSPPKKRKKRKKRQPWKKCPARRDP